MYKKKIVQNERRVKGLITPRKAVRKVFGSGRF